MFKKLVAEFIGTFVLVFCACGVAAITNGSLVATSMAFGLVIVAMAYTIGRISGCHINPAVSLAFLIKRKMTVKEFFLYVAAQVLGGLFGALLIIGCLKMAIDGGTFDHVGNACNGFIGGAGYNDHVFGAIIASFIVEVVLTCIFVFVILHVTDEKSEKVSGKLAGIIIGLTLTLVHLVGIGLTGTSVNPARSLATAISSAIYGQGTEALKEVWVFIVAPLAGGALAALLHTILTKDSTSETKEEVRANDDAESTVE